MTIPDPERLRRWLLHALPRRDAEALEERLFDVDAARGSDFVAALRDAENDLIDDYARGRLTAEEHRAVQRHLLQTGADRTRLAFARALALRIGQGRSGRFAPANAPAALRGDRRPAIRRRWLVGGGVLAAALAATVVLVLSGGPVGSPPSNPTFSTGPTQTITLLASAQRGTGDVDVRVRATTPVRLQAEIAQPVDGVRYRLRISDGGRLLFESPALDVRQAGPYRYVESVVPADRLMGGAREVSVRGEPDAGVGFSWSVHAVTDP